jgi:2-oxoacid dehydrogenases acyltransferase (catalytic domain)
MMPMKKILSVLVIFLPVAASAGDWKPCTNGDYIDRHGNRRWHGLPRWALKIDVLHDGSKLDPGDGITNGGVYGSLMSTPILNVPQSGILGMHKIQERPVAVAGKIEVRPMMYLALTYDHRIVDGKEAVTFLVRVKEALEDPARLVLEV